MDKQRIDEIKARVEAATPGPWEQIGKDGHIVDSKPDKEFVTSGIICDVWSQNKVDAAFIAHARTDIPDLLSHIATLTAALQDAEKRADVIMSDLHLSRTCHTCKHDAFQVSETCRGCDDENKWQWRGPAGNTKGGQGDD